MPVVYLFSLSHSKATILRYSLVRVHAGNDAVGCA